MWARTWFRRCMVVQMVDTCGHEKAVWLQRIEYVNQARTHRRHVTAVRQLCFDCMEVSAERVAATAGVILSAVELVLAYVREPTDRNWAELQAVMNQVGGQQEAMF